MKTELENLSKALTVGLILAVMGGMVIGGLASPAIGSVNAQTNSTTTTQQTTTVQTTTATTTEETVTNTPTQIEPETTPTSQAECEPQSATPQLSQARLYASEKVIEAGQPGQISGGFQVAPDANCPVVVSITMSVPSGMTISGASDVVSSGAGMATAQFTVEPGEIKDIRANVYSQNTGDRTVTADITYWIEGNQDKSSEIDGISMSFDVQEPHTQASPEETENEGGISVETPGFSIVTAILGVALSMAILIVRRRQ